MKSLADSLYNLREEEFPNTTTPDLRCEMMELAFRALPLLARGIFMAKVPDENDLDSALHEVVDGHVCEMTSGNPLWDELRRVVGTTTFGASFFDTVCNELCSADWERILLASCDEVVALRFSDGYAIVIVF